MSEVFKVGDFGRFHFTVKSKKKGSTVTWGHELYAHVEEISGNRVLLRDNDGYIHIPKMADIDLFEEAVFEPVNQE